MIEGGIKIITYEQWLQTDLQKDIWNNKYRYNSESFEEFFNRVADNNDNIKQLMFNKKFLPAGRILANRGLYKDGRKVTYSNCYVASPPEDNIESIFECATKIARTYSYGGGIGIDISKLSPRGAKINNAAKETTGSVSFMELYSLVTGLIGQEGRRGALMISLDCAHPDLEEFINIKNDLNKINKANISIRISDKFMQAVKEDKSFELYYYREQTNEEIKKTVNAKDLFRMIAENNWRMAEPGFLMWDRINNWNLLSEDKNFKYAGVNPCAEECLPAGGSCLLGSFNLAEYVLNPFTNNAKFDFDTFKNDIKTVVIYMNEILDEGLPLHPLQEQKDSVRDWRQIGIGYMGLGDMFIELGIKYGSPESIILSDQIGFCLINNAIKESSLLAKEKGTYPKYNAEAILNSPFFITNTDDETKKIVYKYGLRNSQLLTCAPTGTLSTMLGISGGLEPIFELSYNRKTESLHNEEKIYKVYTPIVKEFMEKFNLQDESELPDYFVTSMNLNYQERIAMQGIWQKHIDASISSTVNVPEEFAIEQVEDLYMKAWEMGLKGVTIFRNNCERVGILTTEKDEDDIEYILERGSIIQTSDDLIGRKRKAMTGCGSLHIQAYFDPGTGELMEVFLDKGSSGGCAGYMVGLSRLISLSARGGIPLESILDQLNSVPACPSYVARTISKQDTSKGNCCPIAISKKLIEMQKEIWDQLGIEEDLVVDVCQDKTVKIKTIKYHCPECGEELRFEGGCNTCPSCGYSKCS